MTATSSLPFRTGKRGVSLSIEKCAYLLVQMVITPLMRLELVDAAVALAAEVAVESLACFPR